MVKINGSSFPHQYRRTNPYPIDSTETWASIKEATEYARNTDAEPYMPYAGQVISIEGQEDIYVLVEDKAISKSDGREHFKLHKISTQETAEGIYLSKLVEDTAQKLIHFLEGINVKGEAKMETLKVLGAAIFSDTATFEKSLSSSEFISGNPNGQGWAIYLKEFVNSGGIKELRTILEIDELDIRKRMRVYEMIVSQLLGENGTRLTTDMIEVLRIDKINMRIYIDTQNGKLYNPFRTGDYIMVQQFDEGNFSVNKEYEFVVSGISADYITYSNFVGSENDVREGDTLVRVDSMTDVDRKGLIKHTSVEANGPYIDIVYGMKTDPENATRTRIGNLSGITTPYWRQLKDYGIFCDNGYFRGDFMLRSGEDIFTKFQVTDANIRAEINSVRYDVSEKDNYLKNASFVYDMTYWEHSTAVNVYSASGEMVNVNANLYSEKSNVSDIVLYNNQYMLRVKSSGVKQLNKDLNHKPDKVEKFDISLRYLCKTSGTIKVGFTSSALYVEESISANSDFTTKSWSGDWDGTGDFILEFSGDIYIKTLTLTTDSLESFKTEMNTVISTIDGRIDAYVEKTDNLEQTTTQMGISINGLTEDLKLYYKKSDAQNYIDSEIGVAIDGVNSTLESYYRSSEVDSMFLNIGNRIDGIDESLTLYASKTDTLERNYTDVGTRLSAAEGTLTNYAEFKSVTENSLTQVNQQLNALEGSLETTVRDMVAGEVSGAAQNLAAQLYASSEDILSRIKGYSQDGRITPAEKTDIISIYESIKSEMADTAVDAGTPSILEANSPVISRVLAFLDAGINTGETIKTNLRTAINALKTKYSNLKMGLFSTTYTLEGSSAAYPLLSSDSLQRISLLDADKQIYPLFKEYVTARNELANLGVEASREWIVKNQTTIDQASTSIGLLVKKTEGGEVVNAASIIAAINESGDGEIKLVADKITLEGFATDNKGFSIENGYMTAKGGKIGGFEIDGYGLSNYSNADAFISIETQKTRTSGNQTLTAIRKAILGNGIPSIAGFETASMFQASGDDENIAVKINAYGSSTYDYKYGGKANYALVASGGCQWKLSEAGDTWCMPGVLGCVEIYTTNSGINLNRKWGNGISINRIALNAEREYEFYHNLGHTDYYFLAMPSVNWVDGYHEAIPSYTSIENNVFRILFRSGNNDKAKPAYFMVIIFGRPA